MNRMRNEHNKGRTQTGRPKRRLMEEVKKDIQIVGVRRRGCRGEGEMEDDSPL